VIEQRLLLPIARRIVASAGVPELVTVSVRQGKLSVRVLSAAPVVEVDRVATLRIRADGPQGFANQVTVCSSLIFAPPISRVLEDSMMSRFARGERNTRATVAC
jgi:hypothetical protein